MREKVSLEFEQNMETVKALDLMHVRMHKDICSTQG